MKHKLFWLFVLIIMGLSANAGEKPVIRLGALAFGTVNWELEALKNSGRLQSAPYQLQITPLATPQSGKIALQSGSVDMIVADWVWVSRLRGQGVDVSFYPYSATSGGLVFGKDKGIEDLVDLSGKRLGIAGGELDKNWLLLQALGQKENLDLNSLVNKVYGAPPLLNQQLTLGRLDAVLTYWHFAARLEAQGYRQLLDGQQILAKLGVKQRLPMLGYVFNRTWAGQHKAALNQFFKDVAAARDQLCEEDAAWQAIVPLLKTASIKEQALLRTRYCQGRIKDWSPEKGVAAQTVYHWLKKLSGNKLTGASEQIQPGTFWYLAD
jgi:NitT/TauT family transport system substrate-binding protein